MNFRCFSLVGLVCFCAPFGVSSTLEHDKIKLTYEGSFLDIFTRDAKRSIEDLNRAEITLQDIAKSVDVNIPKREKEISVFSSSPESDETEGSLTLKGSFFQVHGDDLCEIVSLSRQLDRLATLIQQSLNSSSAES